MFVSDGSRHCAANLVRIASEGCIRETDELRFRLGIGKIQQLLAVKLVSGSKDDGFPGEL